MQSIDVGETAFLKPDYLPVTVVGRDGEFVRIQHPVDPEKLVTQGGATLYGEAPVEIIGDTDMEPVIEYAVRADLLVCKRDFDGLSKDRATAAEDADDSEETEDSDD